jgi:polar amino acid transport system permease protein
LIRLLARTGVLRNIPPIVIIFTFFFFLSQLIDALNMNAHGPAVSPCQ